MSGIEHPLQRRALVPGLQVVEAAASLGRYQLREERRDDTPGTPFLHDQRTNFVGVVGEFRAQRLEHQLLAGELIGDTVQQRRPRIVQHFVDAQPVEGPGRA
jgi:hypothetical protein